MEIVSKNLNIDFMRVRKAAVGLSVVPGCWWRRLPWRCAASTSASISPGGTLIEVGYQQDVELDSVRRALADGGFGGAATVQRFGTCVTC